MTAFHWLWEKYGLSHRPGNPKCIANDIVCAYLLHHPKDEAMYLKNESGFGYFSILAKAEKLYKIRVYGDFGEFVENYRRGNE